MEYSTYSLIYIVKVVSRIALSKEKLAYVCYRLAVEPHPYENLSSSLLLLRIISFLRKNSITEKVSQAQSRWKISDPTQFDLDTSPVVLLFTSLQKDTCFHRVSSRPISSIANMIRYSKRYLTSLHVARVFDRLEPLREKGIRVCVSRWCTVFFWDFRFSTKIVFVSRQVNKDHRDIRNWDITLPRYNRYPSRVVRIIPNPIPLCVSMSCAALGVFIKILMIQTLNDTYIFPETLL